MKITIKYWACTNKTKNTFSEKQIDVKDIGYTPDTWEELDDDSQDNVVFSLPKAKADWGYSVIRG